MTGLEAQQVISKYRGDSIVVGTMSAHYEWPTVTSKPELDCHLSVMGKGSSFALGLALARPDKKVILLDGDGSLLMNLGNLVTVIESGCANLIYFLIDNGCYRCCEPSDDCPGFDKTDFAGFARAAGFQNVETFGDPESLDQNMQTIMNQRGPVFIWLKCDAVRGYPPFPYVEPRDYFHQFKETLSKI